MRTSSRTQWPAGVARRRWLAGLRAVLAGDTLTGPGSGLDTTSSMCARYD